MPSASAARSVSGEVDTHVTSRPRRASAGRNRATVVPVPRPTVIPSSTSVAAASAAARFSASRGSIARTVAHGRGPEEREPRGRAVDEWACSGIAASFYGESYYALSLQRVEGYGWTAGTEPSQAPTGRGRAMTAVGGQRSE